MRKCGVLFVLHTILSLIIAYTAKATSAKHSGYYDASAGDNRLPNHLRAVLQNLCRQVAKEISDATSNKVRY